MNDETQPQILLVEDNPGDARYIREMLREAVSLEKRAFDGGVLAERGFGTEHVDARSADPPPSDTGSADSPPSDTGSADSPPSDTGSADPPPSDIESADHSESDGNSSDAHEPGESVVHETHLEDGLEYLDDAYADVVLLDLDLPDSEGLDTLTTLLEHDDTVPVVVLTGLSDREVGMEALRRGAEEFLVKDEINPGLLVRSIHHAIERRAHRREQKRYETLIEESTDVNAIIDDEGRFQYVTPSTKHVLGYAADELVGENAFEYVHPDDRVVVREEFDRLVSDPDYRATVDFRFQHADGSWVFLDARGRNLLDDSAIGGLVVYTRDITEQREYERRLESQRERLAALNQLNGVVHSVTEAAIDQSTREEIEQITCERLAASNSYEFAWIAEPDPETQDVNVRAEAGAGDYLDDVSVSVNPDDPEGEGPTGRALRTGETQTVDDVQSDPTYEPWRELSDEYGFQSSAAVPLRHEDTTYGVLNVYADRPDAFREQERTVVEHLGRLVGHAIAATERKQALMSDTVVELEFRIRDATDAMGVPETPEAPMQLERTIPVGDGEFIVYGTTGEDAIPAIEEMVDSIPSWESVSVVGERIDGVRFQLRLSDPPILSDVANLGGSVEQLVVDDDVRLTVHLPQDVEVREVVEALQEEYGSGEAVARRQVAEHDDQSQRLADVWLDELTDRQRTVVETAYFAGFFEWPRATSGEEVAETLDISGPTFSQHLRAAENKIFARLVGDEPDDSESAD